MKKSAQLNLIKNFICLTLLATFATGCNNSGESGIQKDIDSLASKWIPDSRTGIWDVNAEPDGSGTIVLKGETTNAEAKDDIIKALNKRSISFIDSILILPDTINNKKYYGLVTLSVINLRKEPGHAAELVSQALLGTPVLILKNLDDWLLIQTPDRYIAWTEMSSIEPMSSEEMNKWKQSERVISTVTSGWICSSPDGTGIVGDLVAGCILNKTGESNGYVNVFLPDGRSGYVSKKSVTDFKSWKAQAECNEDKLISTALLYLGLPYLWGGSSSKAVDCSGFVQNIYFLNGIILQRDASLQELHGQNVDMSSGFKEYTKGDLLFFGTKENSQLHVTHVAVYKGDSEYIHSSGRVRINSLDPTRNNYSSFRDNSLLAVKRIIGAADDPGIVHINKHPWY